MGVGRPLCDRGAEGDEVGPDPGGAGRAEAVAFVNGGVEISADDDRDLPEGRDYGEEAPEKRIVLGPLSGVRTGADDAVECEGPYAAVALARGDRGTEAAAGGLQPCPGGLAVGVGVRARGSLEGQREPCDGPDPPCLPSRSERVSSLRGGCGGPQTTP